MMYARTFHGSENNPNYVIFYEDDIQLQIQVAPRVHELQHWSQKTRFNMTMMTSVVSDFISV